MTRKEMINARAAELSELSDARLVDMIVRYFNHNSTMPGEKKIKEHAAALKKEFDKSIGGLLPEVRNETIEEFASILVKEVKLTHVHVLPTAFKDCMILTDCAPISENTMKNVYEMSGMISGNNDGERFVRAYNTDATDFEFASLPDSFQKNHNLQHGMEVIITASDYSNGKFANMSYTMLIDLGQNLAA